MTRQINTGGPAFPILQPRDPHIEYCDQGMTLRDWFAAHAPGLPDEVSRGTAMALAGDPPDGFDLTDPSNVLEWFKWWAKADAIARYTQADAMIAARGGDQ